MSHVARFLCEVCVESEFPPSIFACAMKFFFAFKDFVSHVKENQTEDKEEGIHHSEDLVLGLACLLVSVKSNESFLNSLCGDGSLATRTGMLIDNSVVSILAYAEYSTVDTEFRVGLTRAIKDAVSRAELVLLRVIGNSFDCGQATLSWEENQIGALCRQFSTPKCLKYFPQI